MHMRTLWRSLSWPVLALCVASCGRIDYDLSAAEDGGVPGIDARTPIDGSVLPPADAAPDASGDPDAWWDPAWSQRVRLTIDTTGQTENLFDIPIAVRLDETGIDAAKVRPDGADLRVVASDNQTLLEYELEGRPTPASGAGVVEQGAVIWVRMPELKAAAAESYFWLYYGNAAGESVQRPEKVWSAGYAGVWHLSQPQDPRDDATGLGNALAGLGPIPSAAGKLGDALAPAAGVYGLPLQRDALNVGDNAGAGLTIEAWINSDSSSEPMIIAAKSDGDVARTFELVRNGDCTTALRLSFDCTSAVELHSPAVADAGSWHHVAATFDGDVMRMYQDGELTAEQLVIIEPPGDDGGVQPSGYTPCEGGAPFGLGALSGGKLPFHGLVDELRVATVAHSHEWIRVQHRATSGGLITFGAQESRP
jgi:biopolymer transport protein ExbB